MFTAKGIFENGQIYLTEKLPLDKRVEVIVTFMDDIPSKPIRKRNAGILSGKVQMSDDFDDPLDEMF